MAKISPSPRLFPFTSSSKDELYLWGGQGDTEPEAVYIYSVYTETWRRQLTNGPHPPAELRNGGCSIAGQNIYFYGGYADTSWRGSLYQLSTDTWTWRELSNCCAGGPGVKNGCRMITYQDQLHVIGGCRSSDDDKLQPKQPGATYDQGYNNEIHCYSISSGTWSFPAVTGSRPPPCFGHSLTMIDEEQAALYGGYMEKEFSDVYILHLPSMIVAVGRNLLQQTWRAISREQNNLWPERRSFHIAACLGYGGQNKSLLISGGSFDILAQSVLNETWLLDLQSGHWEEVEVQNRQAIRRLCHGAASFTISSECTEVTLFGGNIGLTRPKMANTSVLRFEYQNETRKWYLTDTADHTQLGSPNRLSEKRKIAESSGMLRESRSDDVTKSEEHVEELKLEAEMQMESNNDNK